jgi:FkbM family methyltransferase
MNGVKRILHDLSPPVLTRWVRKLRHSFVHDVARQAESPAYFGLDGIDEKLEPFIDFDGGFFIEAGANDGVRYSNTCHFERRRGWTGILVEPAPNRFIECVRNRPASRVFCNALVPFGYSQEFVKMTYCNLMSVSHGSQEATSLLESEAGHIEEGVRHLKPGDEIFEFGAKAIALSELLDREGIDRPIDLLSLDVEGFELNVLKGIDFSRHAPRWILIEIWDEDAIHSFLQSQGYVQAAQLSFHDYLYRRED